MPVKKGDMGVAYSRWSGKKEVGLLELWWRQDVKMLKSGEEMTIDRLKGRKGFIYLAPKFAVFLDLSTKYIILKGCICTVNCFHFQLQLINGPSKANRNGRFNFPFLFSLF